MRLFQYIYYFFRSLYYRGFVNTFKLLSYEKKYETQLGINTHSIVNLDKLTLAGEASEQQHHYQGASYFILFSILSRLPEAVKPLPFVDFGCGKGRALFVAEQCGFTNVIGVDIAKELIEQAEDNKIRYHKKNETSKISFEFHDATTWPVPQNAAVFYFFNPFGADILKKVLQNIIESYHTHPRDIYCIYLNPIYKEVFETPGFTIIHTEKNHRYTEGIIYRYTGETKP